MSRLPTPGSDDGQWGNILNDFLNVAHNSDGSLKPISKSVVGLGNVDDTSDVDKPVSNAAQAALNTKENAITAGTATQYWRGDKSWQTLDKSAVGLGNVDNTSDANKPLGTAAKSYIYSRGVGLVSNGSGLLADNTNFSTLTFTSSDRPVGSRGSFMGPVGTQTSRVCDELIPINPAQYYEFTTDVRQVAGAGKFYMLIAPFDVEGHSIAPYYYMAQTGTLTTLAAPLNPGDTTMTLTDASNWNNAVVGVNTYLHAALFWDYVDGTGFTWPVNTYSRNHSGMDFWTGGAISGNVITLNAPYGGPAHPAGTPVSNATSGSSYMYIGANNVQPPSTWTTYVGRFGGGVHTSGTTSAASTKLPYGTAYVKVGFLVNYTVGDPTSQQAMSNIDINVVKKTDMSGVMDGVDIPFGTTTGSKIGTATTQKLAFYGNAPIAQQAATVDLGTVLSNLGLRVSGTAWPITTSGAVATTGSVRFGITALATATTLTTSSAKYNVCDATSGSFSVTLPATTTTGYVFHFKKVNTANTITINGTIDGATNYTLTTQYSYVELMSTTVSGVWYILSKG